MQKIIVLFILVTVYFSGMPVLAQEAKMLRKTGDDIASPVLEEDINGPETKKAPTAAQKSQGQANGLTRRSRVAKAVQEMLQVAEHNGGIGEQVRTMAQQQSQYQEQTELALGEVKKRNKFTKFLIGPHYKQLKRAATNLSLEQDNLNKLKDLALDMEDGLDKDTIIEQIGELESVIIESNQDINNEQKGFSLFGWLNKLLSQ